MFNIYVKILLLVALLVVTLQTFRFMFSTSYYLSARTSLEAFRAGTWSCELDRRLVIHLRNEIRDKEKLLKYREKVINSLRKSIKQLNTTVTEAGRDEFENELRHLKPHLNSGKYLPLNAAEIASNDSTNSFEKDSNPTPFPADLGKVANTGKKPCCLALKRLTDILRQCMDTTTNLKHKISIYEQTNITAKYTHYCQTVRKEATAKKCSTYFLPKKVDKQKDDMYLTSDMTSVFEALPVYTEPKQKVGNFGAKHRNVDLKSALRWALTEFNKRWKDKGEQADRAVDVIFKSDPLQGNKYIFTLGAKSGRVFTFPVLKPLGPYTDEGKILEQTGKLKELINIIVPISGRSVTLNNFLTMFQEVCVKHKENVFLTIVIYGNTTSTIKLKNIIHKFAKDTGFTKFDILRRDLPFSRGLALDDGVKRWNGSKNVLLFFCDVDVTFDRNFLRRCRTTTQITKQVYYPILFSQYNPLISKIKETSINRVEISAESGTWRPFGFGMACVYLSDYLKVGGFNSKIKGWGGEDNDLYNRYADFGYDDESPLIM